MTDYAYRFHPVETKRSVTGTSVATVLQFGGYLADKKSGRVAQLLLQYLNSAATSTDPVAITKICGTL